MAEAAVAAAAAAAAHSDRVGIGWRPELAAAILSSLDQIDAVEVIADDYFQAAGTDLRALRHLARRVPLTLHAVSLGLFTTERVERHRVERMARVVDAIQPETWSEHLAFVRAGGVEIGHLAAPPRTRDTVEGGVLNVERAERAIGARPLLENIATLIEPPASNRDEATWIAEIATLADTDLLLDLHNLYANATNFGFDPRAFLARIPLQRVSQVHLSGGRWIATPPPHLERRILDDHLHDVPDPVYALLTDLAAAAPRSLTVILERDGNYPPMPHLLRQLAAARAAIAAGRARARAPLGA